MKRICLLFVLIGLCHSLAQLPPPLPGPRERKPTTNYLSKSMLSLNTLSVLPSTPRAQVFELSWTFATNFTGRSRIFGQSRLGSPFYSAPVLGETNGTSLSVTSSAPVYFFQVNGVIPEPQAVMVQYEYTNPFVGFKTYFGIASGVYTNSVESTNTICVLSNLLPDLHYYIAVTALTEDGQESEYSEELVYEPDFVPKSYVPARVTRIKEIRSN